MAKKIEIQDVYERVRATLDIGVRQNRLYIREGKNWKTISPIDLAINIRGLYREEEQKLISSGAVKEVIERFLQNPSVQLCFKEETEDHFIKLKDGVFDVDIGALNENIKGDFGYFLDFSYVESSRRNMRTFEGYLHSVFPDDLDRKRNIIFI